MKKITPAQLKALHTVLTRWCMMEDKPYLVYKASNERTTSSRDLYYDEAKELLNLLNRDNTPQRLRRTILSIAREIGMIYGDSTEDKAMNLAKMDSFFLHNGAVKKPLNEMNVKELYKAQRQMMAIRVDKELHTDLIKADIAVKGLLSDLNVSIK